MKTKYVRGEVCPTCLKAIKKFDRVEINIKTGVTRHYGCAELRPMQKKAIAELDRVMSSMKVRGI